ncbi:hypothetical protein ACWEOE_29615 [Amycolatopsis sp. NPDC004368]
MADRPRAEVVGWLFVLIAAGVAAVAGGLVAHGLEHLPSVPAVALAAVTGRDRGRRVGRGAPDWEHGRPPWGEHQVLLLL